MSEARLHAAKTAVLTGMVLVLAAPFMLLLWLPTQSAAADAACTNPDTQLRPVISTHTMPPYPSLSQMTGEQGTTLVEVSIGTDGAVTKADVVRSSGSVRLDQAAADYVKASWRWEAPTRNCQPVAAITRVSVVWHLNNAGSGLPPGVVELVPAPGDYPAESLARHEQGLVGIIVVLTRSGDISLTRAMLSSGFPVLDEKAIQLVNSHKWTPGQMDGKPVDTTIQVAVRWKLPGTEPDFAAPAPK